MPPWPASSPPRWASVGLGDLPLDTPTVGAVRWADPAARARRDAGARPVGRPPRRADGDARPRLGAGGARRRGGPDGRRRGARAGIRGRWTGRPASLADARRRRARARAVGRPRRPARRALGRRPGGRRRAGAPRRSAPERERLLAMGIWVPGAGPPPPVPSTRPSWRRGARRAPTTASAAVVTGRARRQPSSPSRSSSSAPPASSTARPAPDGRPCSTAPLVAAPGTLTALVGPSGSGKSTVLHALAGFLPRPTPGRSRCSRRPRRRRPRRRMPSPRPRSRPPTSPARSPGCRSGRARRSSPAPCSTRCWRRPTALGEDDARRDRARPTPCSRPWVSRTWQSADPRELSGGEQRRLAVAAALHHGPPVLLADEPTVGQDRRTWAAARRARRRVPAGGWSRRRRHPRRPRRRPGDAPCTTCGRRPSAPGPCRPACRSWPAAARWRCSAAALLAVPAGVLSPHWTTSLAVLATQLVLAVVGLWAPGGRGGAPARARRVAVRMVPGLVAALSVGWSTWFLAGRDLDPALTVACACSSSCCPSAVLIPWIDPDALGDHLAQRLRLPDRPVVATSAALQRVHSLRRDLARARPGPPGPRARGVVARAAHRRRAPRGADHGAARAHAARRRRPRRRDGRARVRDRRSPARGGCRRRGGGATPSSSRWARCRSWWRSSPAEPHGIRLHCGCPTRRRPAQAARGGDPQQSGHGIHPWEGRRTSSWVT